MVQLAKLVWSAWEARNGRIKVLQIYIHVTVHEYKWCTTMLTTMVARSHARGIMASIYIRGSWSGAAWRAGSVVLACLEYTCVTVI